MPKARTRSSKHLFVSVSSAKSPSRAKSLRIKTNAGTKEANLVNAEDGLARQSKANVASRSSIKPKGKVVHAAATSVKQKAKKIVSTRVKNKRVLEPRSREQKNATSSRSTEILPNSRHSETISVLARAAARKRRLDGDEETEPKPKVRKTNVTAKKKTPRKAVVAKPVVFHEDDDPASFYHDKDGILGHEEEVIEEPVDDHPMVAVKHEEVALSGRFDGLRNQHIVPQHSVPELSGEHVHSDVPGDDGTEDEPDDDEEEDIDENLFFGIPDQNSPELATCTHCKGKFRKEDVHEHMLACPERYVQCRECGKILSNLQTLERHHKRFHLKIREVPCTLCDKMFIDEAAARKHLKTVHFKVKSFHCPHCDKSFSQRNKLTYHVRTHSGEKPYSCAECGRAFSLLWNLKTHLRTHTGEKPYSCDTCGRRFTQKQNMTSHLTTHRKPKADKSFRNHFGSDSLEQYVHSGTSGLGKNIVSFGSNRPARNYEASLKQIGAQSIGGGHFAIGDAQNLEVCTVNEQDEGNVALEHGLGLLSSVARKGGDQIGDAVQVDGIVAGPDGQMAVNQNMDQVVEVLIKTSGEVDKAGNPLTTLQFAGSTSNVGVGCSTSSSELTSLDCQEIAVDGATAASLANILQNPEVLAAINAAASTNKFIVIGPVNMFDQSGSGSQLVALPSIGGGLMPSRSGMAFSDEAPSEVLPQEQVLGNTVRSVNDSISASAALAAMERYLQGNPSVSGSAAAGDSMASGVLSAIQADGKRGPTAIVQSVQASLSRASNISISMPPMSQTALTISPRNLANLGNVTSSQLSKRRYMPISTSPSQSEVSSSVDADIRIAIESVSSVSPADVHSELVESTTQSVELAEVQDSIISGSFVPAESHSENTDSVEGECEVGSSGGEPVLMLGTDENGRPQIIVRMPDGSETIMSDPGLAESLIQVPSITNTDILDADAAPDEQQHLDLGHMDGTLELQVPDQSIVPDDELPSQSTFDQTPMSDMELVHHDQVGTSQDSGGARLADENVHSTSDSSLHFGQGSLNDVLGSNIDGHLDACMDGNVDSSSQVVSLVEQPDSSSGVPTVSDQLFGDVPDSSSHGLSNSSVVTHIGSRQSVYLMQHIDHGGEVDQGNEAEHEEEAAGDLEFHVHSVDSEQGLQLSDVTQSSSYAQPSDPFEIQMTNDGVSSTDPQS